MTRLECLLLSNAAITRLECLLLSRSEGGVSERGSLRVNAVNRSRLARLRDQVCVCVCVCVCCVMPCGASARPHVYGACVFALTHVCTRMCVGRLHTKRPV